MWTKPCQYEAALRHHPLVGFPGSITDVHMEEKQAETVGGLNKL